MFKGKKVAVVIPAAGSGVRIGGGIAKQFLELQGKPMLAWTLNQFQVHPTVDYIVIAGSSDGLEQIKSIVQFENVSKVVWIGLGGAQRQDSVWNSLQVLQPFSVDIVLVHDAVRPFVHGDIIQSVVESADEYGAAIPAVKPKDTIKLADEQLVVRETPNRERLWLAQTPQGFSFDVLMKAFHKARQEHFIGTDDASLVERIGVPVKLIEGNYDNFKITTKEDLAIAELLTKQRMSS